MAKRELQHAIGERIRRRRMAQGMMQHDLAREAKLPQEHVSRLERGDWTAINPERLRAVADALKTTLDYLFLRSDDAGPVDPRLAATEAA